MCVQMKSLPVFAVLVTCLLTGLTRQRANRISPQKVSPATCWFYFGVLLWMRQRYDGHCSSHYTFPGYAFLLFQDESSVQALIDACIQEDGKLYLCVSSPTIKDKPVSVYMLFVRLECTKNNNQLRKKNRKESALFLMYTYMKCDPSQ